MWALIKISHHWDLEDWSPAEEDHLQSRFIAMNCNRDMYKALQLQSSTSGGKMKKNGSMIAWCPFWWRSQKSDLGLSYMVNWAASWLFENHYLLPHGSGDDEVTSFHAVYSHVFMLWNRVLYIYINIYIYIYKYLHVYSCAYRYNICMYVYICIWIYTHVYMYTCMYVCMYYK